MRLYKSSEYAIRCLVSMAHSGGGLHSAKSLSDSLDIPYKFLGRLMSLLGSHGVVESVQGKAGGYRIVRPLDDIRLAEIVIPIVILVLVFILFPSATFLAAATKASRDFWNLMYSHCVFACRRLDPLE